MNVTLFGNKVLFADVIKVKQGHSYIQYEWYSYLELRRGIQAAACVGSGKSNLPLELRRKAGHCSRVTAGPIDLI